MATHQSLRHEAGVHVGLGRAGVACPGRARGHILERLAALRDVGQIEDVRQGRREAVSAGVLARVGERRVRDRAAGADDGAGAGLGC